LRENIHDETTLLCKTVSDELFEGMMDRKTHSLLLTMSKRISRTFVAVAFYGEYMSPYNSQRMQSIHNNADVSNVTGILHHQTQSGKFNNESQRLLTSGRPTYPFYRYDNGVWRCINAIIVLGGCKTRSVSIAFHHVSSVYDVLHSELFSRQL